VFPRSLDERLDEFFNYVPPADHLTGVEIAPSYSQPDSPHLRAYALHVLAEHLIPLWSLESLDRFRLGRPLACPSKTPGALETLCPARGTCNGIFPGTGWAKAECWFQNAMREKLKLNPSRIGIVSGEYESEDQARAEL
jgi:hypothetical protein